MPDVPELAALVFRADWTKLSLSARVTQRRDKAVHRRLRRLAAEEQVEEHGPIPRFMLPLDDHLYDGPDWPETEQHILVAPGGRATGSAAVITTRPGSATASPNGGSTTAWPTACRTQPAGCPAADCSGRGGCSRVMTSELSP